MVNVSEVVNSSDTIQILRSTVLVLIFLSFGVFFYFVTIILHVFFTNPHIRENARYVLFAHMLINDGFLLSVMIFLNLVNIYVVDISVPVCYALIVFSACASRLTPYNLAIMSLERFFAICYPLRHAEICITERSLKAIGAMWLLTLTPNFLEFIAICYSMPKDFFSTRVLCTWSSFAMNSFQINFMSSVEIITFALVGLVILYTYIKVMGAARKISAGKSSAFKAAKTVLLHGLQLALCMMAFSAPFTDVFLKHYLSIMPMVNYLFFMHIPRIISPFIYGIRDEVFQKQMQKIKIVCIDR